MDTTEKRVGCVGTVSQATMDTGELISCFIEELGGLDPDAAKEYRLEVKEFRRSHGESWDLYDDAVYMLDDLFDELDKHSPEGCYFGAHPGDGADFGWWPVEDEEDAAD